MFSHFYYVKHQYSSFRILYFIVQLKKCLTITCNTKIIENHRKYNYLVILYNYYLEENYLYILGGILKKNRNFGGLLWVKAGFSRGNRFPLPTSHFSLSSLLSPSSLLSLSFPRFLPSPITRSPPITFRKWIHGLRIRKGRRWRRWRNILTCFSLFAMLNTGFQLRAHVGDESSTRFLLIQQIRIFYQAEGTSLAMSTR